MQPPLAQLREHRRRIADKRDCRADILTDLRRIDIDVNHRLIRAQTAWPAHRPVVRARAEDHQQIALTDCLVGGRRAALSGACRNKADASTAACRCPSSWKRRAARTSRTACARCRALRPRRRPRRATAVWQRKAPWPRVPPGRHAPGYGAYIRGLKPSPVGKSSCARWISTGISISTGPGRPVEAI